MNVPKQNNCTLDLNDIIKKVDINEVTNSWDPRFRVEESYINVYRKLSQSISDASKCSVIFVANDKPRYLRKAGTKYMLIDFYNKEKDIECETELLAWVCSDALKWLGKKVKRDQIRMNSIDLRVRDELASLADIQQEFKDNESISLSRALKKLKTKNKIRNGP